MTFLEKNDSFEGKVIVITAPSGAGKTTIVQHLLNKYDFLDFSVSATNREKRKGEKDGVDYYFLSTSDFKKKIKKGEFLEWEEVYPGKFYGTLSSEVQKAWEAKKHVIFDIEVKGAGNIKKKYPNHSLAIFIRPPSIKALEDRLTNRKTETSRSLKKRLDRAKMEMTYEHEFDKILVNDLLEVALEEGEEMIENFIIK